LYDLDNVGVNQNPTSQIKALSKAE
jgi:hypothetical protein